MRNQSREDWRPNRWKVVLWGNSLLINDDVVWLNDSCSETRVRDRLKFKSSTLNQKKGRVRFNQRPYIFKKLSLRPLYSSIFTPVNIQQKQLFPEGMREFTGIPMQIRKTILLRPANHHTFVCVHGENRGSRWDEERKNYSWKQQTPAQRMSYEKSPGSTWLYNESGTISRVPSPSESCLMLQWMEAPRKTRQQHTLDFDFFFSPSTKTRRGRRVEEAHPCLRL